jgi:hypothetical protein
VPKWQSENLEKSWIKFMNKIITSITVKMLAGATVAGLVSASACLGGGSQQTGAWLSPTLPTSGMEASASLALPEGNTAEYYSEVIVPAGTRYQIGTAAPAFGQTGGGTQVQLLQQIPSASFGPGIPLPP